MNPEWDHDWIDASGRAWSLDSTSDDCAKCGHTPDDHPSPWSVGAERTALERLMAAGSNVDYWPARHHALHVLSDTPECVHCVAVR